MIVLEGEGVGNAAPALGRAAQIEWQQGRPVLDVATLAFLAERERREEGTLQLVLVVSDAAAALWMPLPFGAVLAGIVAEAPLSCVLPDAIPVPVVAAIPEARSQIQDGLLVLVDPYRNCVCVEPSAEEILAMDRRRRRRWLIGAAHAPATTRSGLSIPVIGIATDAESVRTAVREGADGILFREPVSRDLMQEAARGIGGGVLVFPGPPEEAFSIAQQAEVFHLVCEGSDDSRSWDAALRNSPPGSPVPGRMLVVRGSVPLQTNTDALFVGIDQLPLPILDLPPVWVCVADESEIPDAVSGGGSVVCLPAARVGSAKDAVRNCD